MTTLTRHIFRVVALCTITATFTLTTSCKKDDEPSPGPELTLACKLLKSTDADGEIIKVEYDTKDRISKIIYSYDDDDFSDIYEYDNNNRVVKISYFDGTDPDGSAAIEYNANGQWIKFTYKEDGDDYTETYLAEYDGNGNRSKIIEKDEDNITVYTTTFEYANGNLIKETNTYNYGGSTSTSSYTYEYYTDKEDKLKPVKELIGIGYYGTASKNLVKKSTYTGSSGSVSVDNFTYEFNEKGFPTKITTSDNNSSEIEVLEYQCK